MPMKTMHELFKQLGLAHDDASIASFIRQHDGACCNCGLAQAPIWNESQRIFLQDAVAQDSEWSMVSEALQAALSRQPPLAR